MTTSLTSGTLAHSTDADFQAWTQAFEAQLLAVGIVNTSDTGQLNLATALRPATANAVAGYRIYRFNDSLQSTAPIYFKVEYGSSSVSASAPGMWITVGTGTNGAGTITGGAQTARLVANQNGSNVNTATSFRYFCFVSGALTALFQCGSVSQQAMVGFHIARSPDSTGAPSAEGASVYPHFCTSSTSQGASILRFAGGGSAVPLNAYNVLVPNGITSSAVGTDKQVFPHFSSFPRVRLLHSIFTCFQSDLTDGTPTTIDLGYGPRTYLPVRYSLGPGIPASAMTTGACMLCFLWE